jgi:hypothetical protein
LFEPGPPAHDKNPEKTMITLNLTNTSGVAIVAGDGVLPRVFSWMNIAAGANANAVIQLGDLAKDDPVHGGFSVGDLLQSLKQRGKIAFTATDDGLSITTGNVPDEIIATAAV